LSFPQYIPSCANKMSLVDQSYVVRSPGGPVTLETIHYDRIGDHEMLIRNVGVSVCASDLKAAEGRFFMKPPMILGHEAAGIVLQIGAKVTAFKRGDKVVLHYSSCRSCDACATGGNPYCERMEQLNFGGLREEDGSGQVARTADGEHLACFFFGQSSLGRLALVRDTSAVKVDASDEELKLFAALSCGIQTGAGAVLNVCKPPPGAAFAIFGAGAAGLAAALAARLCSASHVIIMDVSQAKLDLMPTGLASHGIVCSPGMEQGSVAAQIKEITAAIGGVDYALDCAGDGRLVAECCHAAKKRGMVVSVGGGVTQAPLSVTEMLVKGLTYRGTHQGDSVSQTFIPRLIQLWRSGQFPFDKLLSHYKLEDLPQALDDLRSGRIVKPILTT
jgi:aryl-alcohol dehydrogenase